MAQGDEYLNSFRSLASLYQERVTVEDVERDMTTTLEEIRNHVKMGKALDAQWAHHVLTTAGSTFTGGELSVAASRLWKTATYAKERLHSFTQRYMLVDAIYRMKVDEDELTRAEKMVQDEKVQNKETFVSVFNKTIEKLEKKIDDIASNLGKKVDHSPPVKRKCYPEAEDQPTTSKMQVISDEEYMRNLIEECRDDDEASPEVAERNTERVEQDKRRRKHIQYEEDRLREEQRRREEEDRRLAEKARRQREQERQQYIRDLERELDDLYKGRFLLPRRKIGEIPDGPVRVECSFCGVYGEHFSDSCALITDGYERYNYIDQGGNCKLCLRKGHPTELCRVEDKGCRYCDLVRNTTLSFLISPKVHHRAICTITDARDRITARIKMVKDQIHQLNTNNSPPGV
ncbi:hypothetical protein OSTOST_10308 [Ostertagia ostertagi]